MFINEWKKNIEQSNSFEEMIEVDIKKADTEGYVLVLDITPNKLNLNGTLHGGVYASLLDIVMGVNIRSQTGYPSATISLTTSYFSPAFKGDTVFAYARILHKGYKIVSAEGEVQNSHGDLLAKGTASFKILRN